MVFSYSNLLYFCCCFLSLKCSNRILDFLQLVIILSVSLLSQTVVHGCQLLEKSKVWLNLPGVPHVLESLGGGVAFLQHEVGAGYGGGPAITQEGGNEDHPTPSNGNIERIELSGGRIHLMDRARSMKSAHSSRC